MYDFDGICDSIFPKGRKPTSADGIDIDPRVVRFVEFKSGFQKKITKYNFDQEKACCEKTGEYCEDYWNLFFKNRSEETAELIASIRFKALESYLTLEKQFLPHCQDSEKPVKLIFVVVIDGDPVDGLEDDLAELAGQKSGTNNILSTIRNSLSRLVNVQDAQGNIYCYDAIEVILAPSTQTN